MNLSIIKKIVTKIKSHGHEVPIFYDKEIPKVGSNYICLAVISFDSNLKKNKNYYLQVFLKECKYIKKKVTRDITQNIVTFFKTSFLAAQMKNFFF